MSSKKGKFKTIFITAVISCIITYAATDFWGRLPWNIPTVELAKRIIMSNYINPEITEKQLEDAAINGMMYATKDKYGRYLDEKDYESVKKSMTEPSFVGIGINLALQEDGKVVITSITPNSPAAEAGLAIGDVILKFWDSEVTSETYSEVSQNIVNGKVGDEVPITIHRVGVSDPMKFTLVLREVERNDIISDKIENYGYIKILKFEPGSMKEFNDALAGLTEDGIEGLIIDLRHNPGGMVSEVVPIIDRLVPEGVIATVQNKDREIIQTFKSDEIYLDLPMVVLVDELSASASELLAGVLQDMGKAEIVGTTTYGKAVGQALYSVTPKTGLYLSSSKYYLPSGVSIDGVGVVPDYEVKLEQGTNPYNIQHSKDPHIKKALEIFATAE